MAAAEDTPKSEETVEIVETPTETSQSSLGPALAPAVALVIILVPGFAPAMPIVPALALWVALAPTPWMRTRGAALSALHTHGTDVLGGLVK